MAFKLNFSGFDDSLKYNLEQHSSQGWVTAVDGQELANNSEIGTPWNGISSYDNRKLTINGVEYTLNSSFGNGTVLELTLKNTNVNIVLGPEDSPGEVTSPSSYYFYIYFSFDDTSKLIIGFDGLKHFKEKQDAFNEGKFALKSNIIPYEYDENTDTYKATTDYGIIQQGAINIADKITSYTKRTQINNEDVTVYSDNDVNQTKLSKWSLEFRGEAVITSIRMNYTAGNIVVHLENPTAQCDYYFKPDGSGGTIATLNDIKTTYRHQVELGDGEYTFLLVFYSTKNTPCNSNLQLRYSTDADGDYKASVIPLNANINAGILTMNASTSAWTISGFAEDASLEVSNFKGTCKPI